MDDIADYAAVSKPVLYQHFPGKHELFLDLMDMQIEILAGMLLDSLLTSTDNKNRVSSTVQALFRYVNSSDGGHLILFDSGLSNDTEVRERIVAVEMTFIHQFADAVSAATGVSAEEARLVSYSLTDAVLGAAKHWIAIKKESPDSNYMSADEAAQITYRFIWRGLRGVGQDS